jgi:hypothetical protein
MLMQHEVHTRLVARTIKSTITSQQVKPFTPVWRENQSSASGSPPCQLQAEPSGGVSTPASARVENERGCHSFFHQAAGMAVSYAGCAGGDNSTEGQPRGRKVVASTFL